MSVLKTLFLNPPSFENFDGGASSRWPATREIESYWYPVWLAYPAGMLEGLAPFDGVHQNARVSSSEQRDPARIATGPVDGRVERTLAIAHADFGPFAITVVWCGDLRLVRYRDSSYGSVCRLVTVPVFKTGGRRL